MDCFAKHAVSHLSPVVKKSLLWRFEMLCVTWHISQIWFQKVKLHTWVLGCSALNLKSVNTNVVNIAINQHQFNPRHTEHCFGRYACNSYVLLYYSIPSGTSQELKDLLLKLLKRNAKERIEFGKCKCTAKAFLLPKWSKKNEFSSKFYYQMHTQHEEHGLYFCSLSAHMYLPFITAMLTLFLVLCLNRVRLTQGELVIIHITVGLWCHIFKYLEYACIWTFWFFMTKAPI